MDKTKENTLIKQQKNKKYEFKTINDAIWYVELFDRMPYNTLGRPPKKDNAPFWVSNNQPPCYDVIIKKGSNCAGLINLVRRYMGLEIPGNFSNQPKDEWAGGTYVWFEYLKNNNRLQKIDHNKSYPIGTLLIQDFNPKDQGHLAMTINKGVTLLDTKIIHNVNARYKENDKPQRLQEVNIHKLKDYYYYSRFTHICLPENWLLKN